MEEFMVGGAVRDEIMGSKPHDFDYTVVMDETDFNNTAETDPFIVMRDGLLNKGFTIFLETPQYFTIRARFPKNHSREGQTADFVLARKESDYTDGRRPDRVEVGDLFDDLKRRDFTCNAIAKDASGTLIDPHNGVWHIESRILRAVGEPLERLSEDALRAVRALRFAVTKRFEIEPGLVFAMSHPDVINAIEHKISDERISQELSKMFRFNTVASLFMLNKFSVLTQAMFAGSVSLESTMKMKGRNKSWLHPEASSDEALEWSQLSHEAAMESWPSF